MPIIPDSPSVDPYMKAVAAFTELVLKLSGIYSIGENNINGQEYIPLIAQITSEIDKLLTNKLYDIFYTQYKGTLNGLNIRYKEYKGAPEEQEWLNNIIEDSADLLALVKEQFETELQNNHERTVITLGLYTDVCLFRATAMSVRKHTYKINRDKEVKDMLQECNAKLDIVKERVQRIYNNKKIIADTCIDPEPTPGTISLPFCHILRDEANQVRNIILNLETQRTSIQSAISVIPL